MNLPKSLLNYSEFYEFYWLQHQGKATEWIRPHSPKTAAAVLIGRTYNTHIQQEGIII